jgi:phosphopantothenoylcysteine synthetase/decarboxylase
MKLKNKKVLITAGPTWCAIDKVRVISNIATGETGILLAEKLNKLGAEVTLILGPVRISCLHKKIEVLSFRFFSELKDRLETELSARRYDILIHSAAVSDYQPLRVFGGKIKSDLKEWGLKLVRTPKLIDRIKKIAPYIFLVGFKFQPAAAKNVLIAQARRLIRQVKADLIVANALKHGGYQAYIVDREGISTAIRDKKSLADRLIKYLQDL